MASNSYSDFVDKRAGLASTLTPIFLDGTAIHLPYAPNPAVAEILAAAGKRPDKMRVVRLANPQDATGPSVRHEDIIDRITPAESPIHLRCFDKSASIVAASATDNGASPDSVASLLEVSEEPARASAPPAIDLAKQAGGPSGGAA